jgi:hypothetical protein
MAKQYQVVGACATDIPVGTSQGETRVTLYRGAVLPEDTPQKRIEHLLSVHLIEEMGAKPEKRVPPVTRMEEEQQKPPSGESPKPLNGQSLKADLVAHAVTQGMAQDDAEKLTRDQLLDMYVRNPAE